MISLSRFVTSETANVWLRFALLFNLDLDNLNLVVCKSDLDLEHSWHDEFICLNRVEVMLLLLFASGHHLTWNMNLILLPITVKKFVNDFDKAELTFACSAVAIATNAYRVLPDVACTPPIRSSFPNHPSPYRQLPSLLHP